jgi:hypothetical protein
MSYRRQVDDYQKHGVEVTSENLNKWYSLLWLYMAAYALFLSLAMMFASMELMRDTELTVHLSWHITVILIVSGTTTFKQLKHTILALPLLLLASIQLVYESCVLISECFSCTLTGCNRNFTLFLLTSALVWAVTFCSIAMFLASCLIYKFSKSFTKYIKKQAQFKSNTKNNQYDLDTSQNLMSNIIDQTTDTFKDLLLEQEMQNNEDEYN